MNGSMWSEEKQTPLCRSHWLKSEAWGQGRGHLRSPKTDEFFKQCWPETGQGQAQGPLFAWVELRTCPPAARGYKGCSRVAPAFPQHGIHPSRSLARWACTELSASWGLPSYLLPSALFERVERQIKAFSLRAAWVTPLESLVEEKTHSGLFWAVLLKESTGPLKYLQAQFRSPWKFHCNVVWYVIQQNKIFPVNVLNMCSSNQQVQRGQQWAEMRGCISACSCITLTSKESLEIAVPLFAAFMEDEKKKREGRKSFLGAGATCLVHISVYKRERDDSAAVQWIFCWHEVEMIRRVNSSCRFYFISFTSRKCPSLHKILIIVQRDETQAQHGPWEANGCGWGRTLHLKTRSGSSPICGWICAGAKT